MVNNIAGLLVAVKINGGCGILPHLRPRSAILYKHIEKAGQSPAIMAVIIMADFGNFAVLYMIMTPFQKNCGYKYAEFS